MSTFEDILKRNDKNAGNAGAAAPAANPVQQPVAPPPTTAPAAKSTAVNNVNKTAPKVPNVAGIVAGSGAGTTANAINANSPALGAVKKGDILAPDVTTDKPATAPANPATAEGMQQQALQAARDKQAADIEAEKQQAAQAQAAAKAYQQQAAQAAQAQAAGQGLQPSYADAVKLMPAPATPADAAKKRMNLSEIYEKLLQENTLTKEQQAELDRKRRRDATIRAVGDGISALANLYATTRYAAPVAQPAGLSEAGQKRWEKMESERKERQTKYAEALNKARALEEQLGIARSEADTKALEAQTNKEYKEVYGKVQQQNADTNEAYKRAKTELDRELSKYRMKRYEAAAAKDEYMLKYYDKMLELRERGVAADEAEAEARAYASYALGDKRKEETKYVGTKAQNSGGKKSAGFPVYKRDGSVVYIQDEKEAKALANREETLVYDRGTETTKRDKYGNGAIVETTQRDKITGWHSEPPKKPQKPKPQQKQQQKKPQPKKPQQRVKTGVNWNR